MKTVNKYTAIQLGTETVNDNVNVKLSFGEITGPYYSTTQPTEEFDTEEEADRFINKIKNRIDVNRITKTVSWIRGNEL